MKDLSTNSKIKYLLFSLHQFGIPTRVVVKQHNKYKNEYEQWKEIPESTSVSYYDSKDNYVGECNVESLCGQ